MGYHIGKFNRPYTGKGYSGGLCALAVISAGKTYSVLSEAQQDALKLEKVSNVAWVVTDNLTGQDVWDTTEKEQIPAPPAPEKVELITPVNQRAMILGVIALIDAFMDGFNYSASAEGKKSLNAAKPHYSPGKIQIIKAVRSFFNLGLKEAKDIVDAAFKESSHKFDKTS